MVSAGIFAVGAATKEWGESEIPNLLVSLRHPGAMHKIGVTSTWVNPILTQRTSAQLTFKSEISLFALGGYPATGVASAHQQEGQSCRCCTHSLLKSRNERSGGSMERAIAPTIHLQKNRVH